MMSLVDPSGFVVKAMGRMPALMVSVQATVLLDVSITLMVLVGIDPATANLPSGVTYTLWIAPFTAMLFTLPSEVVSIRSTAPGASAIATYTCEPSFVTATLLGRPLNGIRFTTLRLLGSTTSSVLIDSLVT